MKHSPIKKILEGTFSISNCYNQGGVTSIIVSIPTFVASEPNRRILETDIDNWVSKIKEKGVDVFKHFFTTKTSVYVEPDYDGDYVDEDLSRSADIYLTKFKIPAPYDYYKEYHGRIILIIKINGEFVPTKKYKIFKKFIEEGLHAQLVADFINTYKSYFIETQKNIYQIFFEKVLSGIEEGFSVESESDKEKVSKRIYSPINDNDQ
jgi:hypothetical protein